MSADPSPEKVPSDVVGEQLRSLRKSRRMLAKDLAARCKEVGYPELTVNNLYSIENGRRKNGIRTRHVTIDELLALGRAFEVSPLAFLGEADGQRAHDGNCRSLDLVEDLTSAVQDAVAPQPTTNVAARIRTARRLMAQLALELDEVEDRLTRNREGA